MYANTDYSVVSEDCYYACMDMQGRRKKKEEASKQGLAGDEARQYKQQSKAIQHTQGS